MILVKNQHGVSIDYTAALAIADTDLCERVAADLAPCSEQDFFTAYCAAHLAKYGEPFECDKFDPVF